MAATTTRNAVSVLLLGSGWTSKFVVPLLKAHNIAFAQTRRTANASQSSSGDAAATNTLPFTLDDSIDDAQCRHLPQADLVLVVFPLRPKLVKQLVTAYERATDCTPAWLALGSTGAWSSCKGVCTSDTPVSASNERAGAEQELLDLHGEEGVLPKRQTAVLNLSGLYGAERNPCNFAKRACDTKDKVQAKTSLHLIHGIDVARVVLAMLRSLPSQNATDAKHSPSLWGRRWMVTDGNAYDWWQLLSTLQPAPIPDGPYWVQSFRDQHNITSLPRPWPPAFDSAGGSAAASPPHVMERVLDSTSFWQTLGTQPSVGRCDDYRSSSGGGTLGPALTLPATLQGSL